MKKTLKDTIKKTSKEKPILSYIGLMLVIGVFLMLLSGPLLRHSNGDDNGKQVYQPPIESPARVAHSEQHHYEQALERRLEEILSLVDGAGDVRVMVSFSAGRETVFAVDRNISYSQNREEDSQGGTRYQSSQSAQDKTLIVADRPLVLREVPPVIGGVMIIAEGGDDVVVRDALIRATSTVLGIDINKVQVARKRGD